MIDDAQVMVFAAGAGQCGGQLAVAERAAQRHDATTHSSSSGNTAGVPVT